MSQTTQTLPPNVSLIRAFFAPVNRATATPTLFDPAALGSFNPSSPPAPWIDLGTIRDFKRTAETEVAAIWTGAPASVASQSRSQIGAAVSLRFDAWGKLQMALAAGSQQLNLLNPSTNASPAGSGGTALPATSLGTGSTATSLVLASPAAGAFPVGSMVVVDIDNTGQTGFIGSGISGAYLRSAVTDIDYIRRISLNVGLVAANNNGVLTLASSLVAGVPTSAMKVSQVVGFCDREGSSFFAEWSAVFVAFGQQGERVLWHYPRLQTMAGTAELVAKAPAGLSSLGLASNFRALPVKDPVDGETVVCFRSYLPG